MVYINKLLLEIEDNELKEKIKNIKYKTLDNEDNIDELFNIKDLHLDIDIENENWNKYL